MVCSKTEQIAPSVLSVLKDPESYPRKGGSIRMLARGHTKRVASMLAIFALVQSGTAAVDVVRLYKKLPHTLRNTRPPAVSFLRQDNPDLELITPPLW